MRIPLSTSRSNSSYQRPLIACLVSAWIAGISAAASPILALCLAMLGGLWLGVTAYTDFQRRTHNWHSLKRVRFALLGYEWLVLGLLGPLMLFPGGWRWLAVLVIPLLWTFRWAISGSPVSPTPLNIPILVLLVMVFVSEWATHDLAFSLPKITSFLWSIAIFFAASEAMSRRRSWLWGLLAVIAIGLGIALLGILGTQWPTKMPALSALAAGLPSVFRKLPGAASGFNGNEVGGALIWVIPVALSVGAAGLRMRSIGWALIGLVAGASMAIVLILSQSRGAILGLGIGLLGIVLMEVGSRRWIVLFLIVAALVFAASLLGPQRIEESLGFNQPEAYESNLEVTVTGRLVIWSRALAVVEDFPFTGVGMNGFRAVMPVLYPAPGIAPDFDVAHAHNEFIQTALDLGIPGLIAFVALYVVVSFVLAHAYGRAENPFDRLAIAGIGGGLLAHAVYGLTDVVGLGSKPGFVLWLLFALAVRAQYSISRRGSRLSSAKSTVERP